VIETERRNNYSDKTPEVILSLTVHSDFKATMKDFR